MNNYKSSICEAAIAVKKNRIKVYPTNVVYLQDKQEFEIELFNPTTSTKLAKIYMNGKLISNKGIVLKPGQRAYIERYIDEPKKFLFETYIVDGSDAEALIAIANNGFISVQFFDEETPKPNFDWLNQYDYNWQNQRSIFGNNYDSSGLYSMTSANIASSNNTASLRSSINPSSFSSFTSDVVSKSMSEKETGRIEKGSSSNQKFTNYTGSFKDVVSNIVTIRILPVSEQPVEVKDLETYCTECGSKNKGGKYKFCPTCGTKY